MTVLVLAQDSDRMVDAVVAELGARSTPVFRVDTAWFPQRLTVAAEHDGTRWVGELRTEYRSVSLGDVGSVWNRTPGPFQFDRAMNDVERRFAHGEARFGFGGLLAALPRARWVNHPNRAADAMYKPLQLAVAADCGLRVPRTLVTNDAAQVREFAASAAEGVVVKTFGANTVAEGGKVKVAYTRRLGGSADLAAVETTAHQLQEWVPKAHELRVVAVGDAVFPVEIHAHTAAARVDWRADYDGLSYRRCALPADVEAGVRKYLATFGLLYACFDFIVDPGGQHWFLEANTSGQYGWLEGHTGAPITAALADLLAQESTP